MATRIWRGDAAATAQVDSLTVGGTVEAGDVFLTTINGKSVSVVATTTVVATTATEIYTALAASTIPEFAELTWSNPSSGVVYATGPSDGKPFTVTATTTETGGGAADAQTYTRAAVTTPSSPNDVSLTANWSGATLPVDGDDVWFDGPAPDVLYNLSSLTAVNPATVYITAAFTGVIGLPEFTGDYYEYRATYLTWGGGAGAIVVNVGDGPGTGSGRIKLNLGAGATTLNVHRTAAALDGLVALYFKGTSASNAVEVTRGSVGIAALPGEAANVSGGLKVGFVDNPEGDAYVYCGTGVTHGSPTMSGGELVLQSNATAVTMTGGTLHQLAGAVTTLTVDRGTVYGQAGGALYTTANVGNNGVLDLSRDPTARTWTTCNLYAGATLYDPATTSGNSPFTTVRCSLADVKINKGINKTYTPS
jgi:hypothetical protein